MKKLIISVLVLTFMTMSLAVFAHSGRTNAFGCHCDHRTGWCHCH